MRLKIHSRTQLRPRGEVGQTANLAQSYWSEQQGYRAASVDSKALYISGVVSLSAAESAFGVGAVEEAYSSLELATQLFHGSVGFGRGLYRTGENLVHSIPALGKAVVQLASAIADDPEAVLAATQQLIKNTPQISKAFAAATVRWGHEFIAKFAHGNAEYRGEVLGRISGEVLVAVGTGGVLGAVTKIGRGAELAEAGSVAADSLRGLLQSSPELSVALSRAGEGVAPVLAVYAKPARWEALGQVLSSNPAGFSESIAATEWALGPGASPRAADFLARAQLAQAPYAGVAGGPLKTVQTYSRLEKAMVGISPASAEVELTRVIPKQFINAQGQAVENTAANLFKPHEGMIAANGRIGLGGAEGNPVLYAVIGNDSLALETARLEAQVGKSAYISGTKTFRSDRVLDLTRPEVLEKLGVPGKALRTQIKDNTLAYEVPQMIGDIARDKFDAVIYTSARDGSTKNIGIFIQGAL